MPYTYSTLPKLCRAKSTTLRWQQYLWMCIKIGILPLVVTYEIVLSPFVVRSKNKPLKRVICDSMLRYLSYLPGPELLYLLGSTSTEGVYSGWAMKERQPITVDELEDGGKLLWIGPKKNQKVLLYCHGGGFVVPVLDFMIKFWRYIQLELEKRGLEVGVAMMCYSLVPEAHFPTPLWQVSRAIHHLISIENVKPSNIQLVGDSAGSNLILQIFSSMLHPLFSPPIIPSGTRFRGAYLLSPWISLTGVGTDGRKETLPSFQANEHSDVASRTSLLFLASSVFSGLQHPSSDIPYVDPIHAPADWFRGLPDVVERVFVSTGGGECLRDHALMFFEERIRPWHGEAEFFEHEGGVHNDPYFDFAVGDKPLGSRQKLTPRILNWVIEGFEDHTPVDNV